MPAQVAEVQVGEVDEIGSAEHQRGEQREEEGELLDEVGVAPDDPADECGEPARAREVPEDARLDSIHRRAGEHGERDAWVVPQRSGALEREGLEAPELPAQTGAREVDAHGAGGRGGGEGGGETARGDDRPPFDAQRTPFVTLQSARKIPVSRSP